MAKHLTSEAHDRISNLKSRQTAPKGGRKWFVPKYPRIEGGPKVFDTVWPPRSYPAYKALVLRATEGVITMLDRLSCQLTMTGITHMHADQGAKRLHARL
jgi:hypothetical protein